jgi:hypothetical protein
MSNHYNLKFYLWIELNGMQLLDNVKRQLKQYSHKPPPFTLKSSHLNDVLTVGEHNHKVITIKNNT